MSDNIKESPLWTIWGEIWNVVKAHYPRPASQEEWDRLASECEALIKKYGGTEFEGLVNATLMEVFSIYEKRSG